MTGAAPTPQQREDARRQFAAELVTTVETLTEPGQVIEIRIPKAAGKKTRTDSGYFNSAAQLADAVTEYLQSNRKTPPHGVYVTLNPTKPDLLARAANRIAEWADTTTSDADIAGRRWLPLDFDPVRPSGISSTDAEHTLALERAQAGAAWLTDQGWPAPIVADSGNGGHLLYRIDLPNDQPAAELVQACLQALATRFDDSAVKVDQTVYNAARIWKLYGTMARKGDNTPDRPHRRSCILDRPTVAEVVPVAMLQALAALAPKPAKPQPGRQPGADAGPYNGPEFNLEDFMARHAGELNPSSDKTIRGGSVRWRIDCPWGGSGHAGDAFLIRLPEGGISAGCSHSSCSWNWNALRDRLEPGGTRPRQAPTGRAQPATSRAQPTPPSQAAAGEGGQARPAEDGQPRPAEDIQPEAEHSTWPYAVEGGRLVRLRESKGHDGEDVISSAPIADFQARIVGTVIAEDGTHTYRIGGCGLRGGPFEFELPALDYGDGRKLAAALEAHVGPYDPILAGQGSHIGPAIKKLTASQIPQVRRYDRTGWAGDHFLIPGRLPSGVEISLNRKLPFSIGGGDLGRGLEGLQALIASMGAEIGPVVLSVLFQAPMAALAGWRNERYALFIKGRTGTLKTSNVQAAMCLYGPDFQRDELLIKWGEGATRGAIMSIATAAHDLPLVIDNFKPGTGDGAAGFVNLIHNILEGGEKDRLQRSSQLRQTKPVFAWPICTGEDLPSQDPASLARILVVPFAWQRGQENPHLAKAQELAGDLNAVGGAWLDWLQSPAGKQAAAELGAKLQEYRARWAAHLRNKRPDTINILRVATNLATNQLAWATVAQHPTIGPVVQPYLATHTQGLIRIAEDMGAYTSESLEAVRFLGALRELLAAGKVVLISADPAKQAQPGIVAEADVKDQRLQDRVIGYADTAGGAFLLPDLARQAVDHLLPDRLGHIENRTLFAQLAELKMIASHDDGKHTKKRKIGGSAQNTLHLTAAALQPDAGAEAVGDD